MVNGKRVRDRRRYQMIDILRYMDHMRRLRGRQKIGRCRKKSLPVYVSEEEGVSKPQLIWHYTFIKLKPYRVAIVQGFKPDLQNCSFSERLPSYPFYPPTFSTSVVIALKKTKKLFVYCVPSNLYSTRHFNIKRHFNKARIRNYRIDKLSAKMDTKKRRNENVFRQENVRKKNASKQNVFRSNEQLIPYLEKTVDDPVSDCDFSSDDEVVDADYTPSDNDSGSSDGEDSTSEVEENNNCNGDNVEASNCDCGNDYNSDDNDNKDFSSQPSYVYCSVYKYEKSREDSPFQSIDESMTKFKGRSNLKQYLLMKLIRCVFRKGFGKKSDQRRTLGERVVLKLVESEKHPKFDGKLEKGQYQHMANTSGAIAARWEDSKEVPVLSNCHRANDIQVLRKQKDGSRDDLPCPESIAFYSEIMGGVDLSDQKIVTYDLNSKSQKWWRKVFFKVLMISVVNSWILYQEIKHKKIQLLEYLISLAEQIMAVGKINAAVKRKRTSGRPTSASKLMLNV
ncbi:hypothetical protein ANN_19379 [Periplaneta americana]|uniref:PiggyBac transposable element-derived protein domain-containing protein n=1 Tax=Periplaneta americana TaxID=6978 RepID=A0ABQ8S9Z0_PERAM|nr:hypothetical protein ANN_19379 [Periplaneta americana]